MANTVITNYGAQYVLSAGDPGPTIAIKYFLPVYDYRLDTNIHTAQSYSTSAITYTSTISATSAIVGAPTGEKIWNDVGYNLSTNFIVSGTGDVSGAGYVSAYKQSSMGIGMNTLNGVPLWPSYYGTDFSPPTLAVNRWVVTNLSANNGVNVQTVGTRSKYWRVTDYYPVTDSSGNIRGALKCHLDKAVGRFKFNKIAMYAVRVNSFGVETADDPVFFAEAFVKETCVKSDILQEGFDDFVVDVQLDLTPLNNYWVSGFYTTSGDYWSKTVGGLYSSDAVGVGSFDGSTDRLNAALHVRTLQDASKHLVRLDASGSTGTSAYQTLNIDNRGNLTLSGTGNFIIKNTLSARDIIPIANGTYSLGIEGTRWASIEVGTVIGDTISSWTGTVEFLSNIESTSIFPQSNNIYDLGDLTHKFANGYITNVSATTVNTTTVNVDTVNVDTVNVDTVNVDDINNAGTIATNRINTDILGKTTGSAISAVTHILPLVNNLYQLGNSNYSFLGGYFYNIYTSNDLLVLGDIVATNNIEATTLNGYVIPETSAGSFYVEFPTGVIGTFNFIKTGNLVKFYWDTFSGLDSLYYHTAVGYPIPLALRPSTSRNVSVLANNYNTITNRMAFGTDGSIGVVANDNTTVSTILYGSVVEYAL